MELRSADTIAAIATAPGRGAIGIVRVSGPHTRQVLLGLAGTVPSPRHASLTRFRDPQGATIDQGISLFFPGPHSYTGEDLAELQAHGGPVVLQSLLSRCVDLGARIAKPGEFTERAYHAGKLDLAQAEAVSDLIDASSRGAARAAARSLSGTFSIEIRELSDELRTLRILVEAAIDFPEEDIDVVKTYEVATRIEGLSLKLESLIKRARQGRMLREGLHVVLAGEPNVGKSSLLNRLAREEVAIVTDIPGTTRDAIRVSIELEGIPIHVTDTAGLRETDETIERIGIEKTRRVLREADAALIVVDAREDVRSAVGRVLRQTALPDAMLVIRNKMDLLAGEASETVQQGMRVLAVSAATGEGIEGLGRALLELGGWDAGLSETVFIARSRHVEALQRSLFHVLQGGELLHQGVDMAAEEFRYAEDALNEIIGWRSPDHLLGDIFSHFCLGK